VILLILPASSESTLRLDVAAPICARQAADVNPIWVNWPFAPDHIPLVTVCDDVGRLAELHRGLVFAFGTKSL
jgi:hypothetical protein